MDDFDSYSKRVMAHSAAIAAVGAIAVFVTTYHHTPELFAGFCLGAAFSMLKWRLIIRELRKFADGRSGVGRWMRTFFIRYGLTGAVIGLSIASPAFSPITAVIGIFLVNMVIIGGQVISAIRGRAKGLQDWE